MNEPFKCYVVPAGPLTVAIAAIGIASVVCMIWRRAATLSKHTASQRQQSECPANSSHIELKMYLETQNDASSPPEAITWTFEPMALYATDSSSNKTYNKQSAGTSASSKSSCYFTPKALTREEAMPQRWLGLQPSLQMHHIPSPLWQDIVIAVDQVDIVQTPAGRGWKLGEGSNGLVTSAALPYAVQSTSISC